MFCKSNQLKYRGVSLLLVLMLAFSALASNVKIKPRKGMNLVGCVTVDGKPRAGVTVSDGVNVVVTDKKGVYQMTSTGRQHVFVSVPADCSMPMSDGMPAFYQTISLPEGAKAARHDFDLQSSPVKDKWTLFTVADPQVGTPDTLDYSGILMPQMRKFVSTLSRENTIGIALGDLVWNSPQLYPLYVEETKSLGIPMLSVIGNHDHNENVKNDTESDADFRNALGPTYYSVNVGQCHIVALDDILYRGVKSRNDYSGRITPQQLEWLKKDLALVDTAKTIIVGLHIPVKRRIHPNAKLLNADSLIDILRPFHRVEILSGHTHYHFTTTIAPNITETTFASAMGALWNPLCADGTSRGFAVLQFDGTELVNKYFVPAATLDPTYQMKLYAPADAVLWDLDKNPGDAYDKILINVFAWHTDWTIETREDNGEWTLLPDSARIQPVAKGLQCIDPTVRKNLVNGRLPSRHGRGATPVTLNDHLFLYKPSPEWKSVSVRATDPYGNVYVETLTNPEK